MVAAYSFQERLCMSQGTSESKDIQSVLLAEIPGALAAYPAHQINDRTGTDWWVEHASGRHLSVDAKVREDDWSKKTPPRDDLSLETWSVVEKKIIGWTRNEQKRSEYILWIWKDSGRWCLIPFPILCKVFKTNWQSWSKQFQTNRQFTPDHGGGYHSECVFVPRRDVWKAIYEASHGHITVSGDGIPF